METVSSAFALFAVVALGLTAGALLAEGAILVPFWRSMPPESFLSWYKQHAALLQKFFGLLEVAAAALVIVAAGLSWIRHEERSFMLGIATLLTFAVLAVFPAYFQRVNTSFATGTIPTGSVADELRRWSSWHWFRTIIAITAFISAVAALMGRSAAAGY